MLTEATSRVSHSGDIAEHALQKLHEAEIIAAPFPHIVVGDFFPDSFFKGLLRSFPDHSFFKKVTYPGTGHGKRASRYREYGLACTDLSKHDLYRDVHEFLRSDAFSRALLTKFSRPLANGTSPIPAEKHRFFSNGASNYATVFDLQIDFPGYELPPHPDVPQKIVTFQYFLVENDTLSHYGTLLCKPKNGQQTVKRPRLARYTGLGVDAVARVFGLGRTRLYRRIELSPLGLRLGVGATRPWLPWELFDVVKVAPALPNGFMAFAPNAYSYHAARMDTPAEIQQERRVIRGFIRSGKDTRNWMRAMER